jgi:hypothetical protein
MAGTARDQILASIESICSDPSYTFTVPQVLEELSAQVTDLAESTTAPSGPWLAPRRVVPTVVSAVACHVDICSRRGVSRCRRPPAIRGACRAEFTTPGPASS